MNNLDTNQKESVSVGPEWIQRRVRVAVATAIVGALALAAQLQAQTTGFLQTGAGPYDYCNPANWVGGNINGTWNSSLTLAAPQTATFGVDTNLPTGLTFSEAGGQNLTLTATNNQTHTVTLGAGITCTAASSPTITLGGGSGTLNVDLGGVTRTVNVTSGGNGIVVLNNFSNGAVLKTGSGTVMFQGSVPNITSLTVSNGQWQYRNYGQPPTTVVYSTGASTTGGYVYFDGTGGPIFTNPITLIGPGSGTLTVTPPLNYNATATYTNLIQQGLITLTTNSPFLIKNSDNHIHPAPVLSLNGGITRTAVLGNETLGSLILLAAGATNEPAIENSNACTIVVNSVINNAGGPLLLAGVSVGEIVMAANGHNIGDTTINFFNNAALNPSNNIYCVMGIANALNTNANLLVTRGNYDLAGYNQMVSGLGGTVGSITNSGAACTLTVGNAGGGLTNAVPVQDSGGGQLALTKIGSGAETLSATNTYSGNTTINGGKLIGLTGGSCSNSAVTVQATSGTATLAANYWGGDTQWTCASLTTAAGGSGPILEFDFNNGASTVNAPLNVTGNVTFSITPTVRVQVGLYDLSPNTTYPLLTVGGTAPSAVPILVIVGRSTYPDATLSWGGNTLYLNVNTINYNTAVAPLHWAGPGAGLRLWDMNDGGNFVWNDNQQPPQSVFYVDGDDVTFDDEYVNTNQVVTLNATVNPNSITASNSLYNYTIVGTGTIGSANVITKTGSSNLTVGVKINTSGTLNINNGTVTLGSATNGIYSYTIGGLDGSNSTLNLTANNLTENGSSGATNIYSGNIIGHYPGFLGSMTATFGLTSKGSDVLQLNGNINLSADLGTFTSASKSCIQCINTAEIDLGGNIILTNVSIYPTGPSGVIRFTGGSCTLYPNSYESALIFAGATQLIVDGGNITTPCVSLGFGGNNYLPGPSLTMNGGSLTIVSNGPGSFNGFYIGNVVAAGETTAVNLNGGTLNCKGIIYNASPGQNVINFNGGTLALAQQDEIQSATNTAGLLLGLMVGNGGAIIDTAGVTNHIYLALQNNGSGGLTVLDTVGGGVLALMTNNTYVGPTVVSNGTLQVNGSLASGSSVTVAAGATLGGSGTIGGATTFNAGAHASFALGSPLTLSGSLTVAASGTIPDAHVTLSNNVPVGTNTLATYSTAGSSGAFSSTPVIDSGSLAAGTIGTIVTTGGHVTLQVVVNPQPNATNITYTVSGATLTLNWPSGQGWLLQSNSVNLGNANGWQTVSGATPPYPITIHQANAEVFYRLKY